MADDKLNLVLSPDAKAAIEEIRQLRGGVSVGEAISQAIGTESFLLEERAKGCHILLEKRSWLSWWRRRRNYREVILSLAAAILVVNGQLPTPCLTDHDCDVAQLYYGGKCIKGLTPEAAGFKPGWDAGIDRVRGGRNK